MSSKKKTTKKQKPNKDNADKQTKSNKKKKKKRAKIQTDSKSKQQRRKILEVRSMQTRFILAPLSDDLERELTPTTSDDETKSNDNTLITNKEDQEAVLIKLSESQEDAINALQLRFEEYDEDYYGFIEYDKFLSILKQYKINLSNKQETYLLSALILIDEGVDYYGFLQILRNKASADTNSNLTKICQNIAIEAEQQAINECKQKEEAKNEEIEVNEYELNRFYEAAEAAQSRGMNLATMENTSMVIPSSNKIRQIVEEFALDGVEVDFAIFKTALAAIDCTPKDDDLIFLINYLAHNDNDNMNDDDLFVDFNYFISFCQEVSNIPVVLWQNPQKIIEKVAKQTRMVYRTQKRRKKDKVKIKERLENRKKNKNEKNKINNELKHIEAEEKRLRALRLRDKAKMVRAPKKGEEKLKLREWINKREKTQSKKDQHELKKWMQTKNVFQKNLYNELNKNHITSINALKKTNTVQMDQILRKVRSDRFGEVKNTVSRNKIDKLLLGFEKQWKKLAGIKKSAKKKKSSKHKK